MVGQVKPIPVTVILAAVSGDENALAAVVAHYQKYIRALATRPVKDEYGNEYLYVDEDMRLRLDPFLRRPGTNRSPEGFVAAGRWSLSCRDAGPVPFSGPPSGIFP